MIIYTTQENEQATTIITNQKMSWKARLHLQQDNKPTKNLQMKMLFKIGIKSSKVTRN